MSTKHEKMKKEAETIVNKVIEEAEKMYTEAHGAGSWENLSRDEKIDFAREVLEKYYDPEKRGYVLE